MQGYWMAVTRTPDVIVTDLQMPRWEGHDLLGCLLANSETKNVPIIIVSGYVTPDERRRLERLGVKAVFDKPVDWSVLLQKVRQLIDRSRRC